MKKILLIDDDKIFLKIFRDTIEKNRSDVYEIEAVSGGREGLMKIRGNKPDLIVLDLKMPEMDGIEFLRELKKENFNPQIPVLISSNFSDVEKVSEGIELGVKGYVIKSDYNLDGIIQQIDHLLE
jgi:CheY-like chemotaxis protein